MVSRIETLSKIILVTPSCLYSDIDRYLFGRIKKMFTDKCDKQYGYILKILELTDFSNLISDNTENIIFKVNFKAKILKPEIGDIFQGQIEIIIPGGILVNVEPFKVFIPCETDNFSTGKVVNVKITNQKYTDNKFKYIGLLV